LRLLEETLDEVVYAVIFRVFTFSAYLFQTPPHPGIFVTRQGVLSVLYLFNDALNDICGASHKNAMMIVNKESGRK
jgi:hypothetical protein